MKIRLCFNNEVYEVEALGALTPKPVVLDELVAGDVGFIVANIKQVADARVGDTVIDAARPAPALPGFEAIKPMVFAGLFPVLASDYENLRDALGKLQLNDAAFFYEPENSVALWDSVFAADSWACCTWRSRRSAWSANSEST